MTITSLSFSFVQYTSTAATADARAAAPALTPASQPVAQDSCHGGGCDSPRRSPLFRALKDALLEMTRSALPAVASSTASTPSTAGAAAASTAAATSTTAGTAQATPLAEAAAAPAAAPDLEHAMMDFARALMQALRSGFQQGRGDDGEHEGRGRHHHHHHHGHRGWGDPAQRVDGLAQRVGAAPAPGMPAPDTSVAPTPTPSSAVAPAASASATTPAPMGDVTLEPAVAGAASAAAGSQNAVIFVASISIQQTAAAAAASPFGTLLNAFAGLQQAMGKPVASGDSLRSELSAFLQSLAKRLRGEDPATAEAATQPGALLSVAA
jgi:hypothetical protein